MSRLDQYDRIYCLLRCPFWVKGKEEKIVSEVQELRIIFRFSDASKICILKSKVWKWIVKETKVYIIELHRKDNFLKIVLNIHVNMKDVRKNGKAGNEYHLESYVVVKNVNIMIKKNK
ncbi:hypothetical protein KUTeg_009431 [Tegillarca granosa]|uniref:Uncharacterized protein n=1 Tax=Tegillarca granosa TaxID=220873 RepID=A0ABQ9F8V0_TEGGR|nr:hypothetical protein KUTeg_009431 [Tegillarca granosa]